MFLPSPNLPVSFSLELSIYESDTDVLAFALDCTFFQNTLGLCFTEFAILAPCCLSAFLVIRQT